METAKIVPEIAKALGRLSSQARERIASRAETPSSLAHDTETTQALLEYLKKTLAMADKTDTVQEKVASENFVRAEINAVRAEMNAFKADLIKWIIGANIGIAGVVVAAASVIIALIMQMFRML